MIDGWLDILRREAQRAVMMQLNHKGTVVCTSYDKKKHAIKGILVPHGIETDWIPVGALHIGDKFGILVGPTPGDPKKLDGDQFDVEFAGGDMSTPVARMRFFSKDDKPPEVESGEIMIKHKSTASIYWDKDGNTTHTGSKGQTLVLDKEGTINTNATKDHVVSAQKGNKMHLEKGGEATLQDDSGKGIFYGADGKAHVGTKAGVLILTIAGPAKNAYAEP